MKRVVKNVELAARIGTLCNALKLSLRQACLRAHLHPDRIKSTLDNDTAPIEVLSALARVLQCKPSYLAEAAPGLRLNSLADPQQTGWLLLYADASPAERVALLAAVHVILQTFETADRGTPAASLPEIAKKGRR